MQKGVTRNILANGDVIHVVPPLNNAKVHQNYIWVDKVDLLFDEGVLIFLMVLVNLGETDSKSGCSNSSSLVPSKTTKPSLSTTTRLAYCATKSISCEIITMVLFSFYEFFKNSHKSFCPLGSNPLVGSSKTKIFWFHRQNASNSNSSHLTAADAKW
jgi:hypothetical protein